MHGIQRFSRTCSMTLIASLVFGTFALLATPRAQAQRRVNDHDMKALMKNLHEDSKSFRDAFDSAIQKSTIRKTSQAKDSRDQAKVLVKQTDHLLLRFQKDHNGEAEFNDVMTTAGQLDNTLHSVRLNDKVMDRWGKIRSEIRRIADAYGVPDRVGNQDMGALGEGNSASCLETAGPVKARQLVSQCLEVSPATHPPCNAQNTWALIVSEIRRSCGILGQGAPGFCNPYR